MVAVSMLVPLLGWSVLTYGGFVEPLFLPTPTAVIQQFFNLLQSGDLTHDIGMSVSRVGWGFLISALISIPSTLPNIIDTLRINIAGAWSFVVVAELVGADSGLGNMIMMAQRFLKTDEIFVGIILIGVIGLGIDFVFKLIFKLMVPWAVNKA